MSMQRIALSKEQSAQHVKIREMSKRKRVADFLTPQERAEGVRGHDYESIVNLVASLKRERERQGLTQAELAAKLGLDPTALSRLENNRAENPTIVTLVRWAAALSHRLTFNLDPVPEPARA
jgi:ribosome-binding protein aMBF1 (putative translation factor)